MSDNEPPMQYSISGFKRRYRSIEEAVDEYLYRTEPAEWQKTCPLVVHRWHSTLVPGVGVHHEYASADLPLDTFTCIMCHHPEWAEDRSIGEHLLRITVLK